MHINTRVEDDVNFNYYCNSLSWQGRYVFIVCLCVSKMPGGFRYNSLMMSTAKSFTPSHVLHKHRLSVFTFCFITISIHTKLIYWLDKYKATKKMKNDFDILVLKNNAYTSLQITSSVLYIFYFFSKKICIPLPTIQTMSIGKKWVYVHLKLFSLSS